MNRLAIAVVAITALSGAAYANQPMAAGASTVKMEDCGAAMKAMIPLPTKFRELMTAVSGGLNMHAAWLGSSKDPGAKAEAKALKKLAMDHAAVAKEMTVIVADFEAIGKVGLAAHDTAKMDPKWGETMMRQVKLEKEMAALMLKHAEDTEKMMQPPAKAPEHAAR